MFLEIRDIQKSFGQNDSRVQVLKGVNMRVEQGDFCVLLGPSGSGKSTLLNIIGGIDTADGGQITIGNITLGKMNPKKLTAYRRNHLGYVFQMYNLIPNLTVREAWGSGQDGPRAQAGEVSRPRPSALPP